MSEEKFIIHLLMAISKTRLGRGSVNQHLGYVILRRPVGFFIFFCMYSITLLTTLPLVSKPPDIQINIKRCLSDGCDTRIHGLKTLGYQITKSKEVSVSDASAIWYLSLLTSLVTASMETNPALAHTVLQSTQ